MKHCWVDYRNKLLTIVQGVWDKLIETFKKDLFQFHVELEVIFFLKYL